MTIAIVSCPGLGDGLISLALANNFYINKKEVVLFHSGSFSELQPFFPYVSIRKFPSHLEEIFSYEKIFVFYDFSHPFIKTLILEGKKQFLEKIWVINASFSSRKGKQPYYEDAKFEPHLSMVQNMELFCSRILHLPKVTKEVFWKFPEDRAIQKNPKKVILHASGAKVEKRWPIEKFLLLYRLLESMGFAPLFVFSEKEKEEWNFLLKEKVAVRFFPTCEELAKEVSSAGYMIGNDSGVGHLASCFGLPTVSIFCHKRKSLLWRPGFCRGEVVYPSPGIPNISCFRLRDIFWKRFISVSKVLRAFKKLTS
ncbi:MAG: glycosyltransferase family 9 protein [Chlamydiota bacterium]